MPPEVVVDNGEDPFGVSLEELSRINDEKDGPRVDSEGGPEWLLRALRADPKAGIDPSPPDGRLGEQGRREAFGANTFAEQPPKGLFWLWVEALEDPIIVLLIVSALVSTTLGVAIPEEREQKGWTEGVAIWVAIAIVTLVSAWNDNKKDKQFRELNRQRTVVEVKALRGGAERLVKSTDLVVGDVLLLDTGDKVPADCYLLKCSDLVVDESSLTGEAEPIHKDTAEDPWCRSGTKVTQGSGKCLVLAVGPHSEWGRTLAMVRVESEDTPLQEKLAGLAALIGQVGMVVAALCFCVLLARWVIHERGFPLHKLAEGPLQFFLFGVAIIVMAVPEGLPLAVTISLGYSMMRMMHDHVLVRHLAACETMGSVTAICSDKTGTLTENRMTVVDGWLAGEPCGGPPSPSSLPEPLREHLQLDIALNSNAFLEETPEGGVEYGGNRTECALLMLLRKWGVHYAEVRDEHEGELARQYGFSSERKMASVLVHAAGGALRLYNKGASEIVLRLCTHYVDAQGERRPLPDDVRERAEQHVSDMADKGLRTLALAYRDFPEGADASDGGRFGEPPERELTLLGVVGIKDPVREEVPGAVAACRDAGITVRMVTGDNVHTAQFIAQESGLLDPRQGDVALEGREFRSMAPQQLEEKIPGLRVLARSSPQDKHKLVGWLKRQGEVVAVTGDGTNDAPALKIADVGLAMGITGTEVAKEAADIIILDDNFASIVKAVMWGRNTFQNIRKFLQFQLTVNFVALCVAFGAAVGSGEMPLNVLQLLWVNLIMDSLGALALATEAPSRALLKQRPTGRSEALITRTMYKHIVVQGIYQIAVLLAILALGGRWVAAPNTFVFQGFIFCQVFNMINCRKINDELNIFEGAHRAPLFWLIMVAMVAGQVFIIQGIPSFFHVERQNPREWGAAVAVGMGSLPVALLTKLLSRVRPVQAAGTAVEKAVAAVYHALPGRRRRPEEQPLMAEEEREEEGGRPGQVVIETPRELLKQTTGRRGRWAIVRRAMRQGKLKKLSRRASAGTEH